MKMRSKYLSSSTVPGMKTVNCVGLRDNYRFWFEHLTDFIALFLLCPLSNKLIFPGFPGQNKNGYAGQETVADGWWEMSCGLWCPSNKRSSPSQHPPRRGRAGKRSTMQNKVWPSLIFYETRVNQDSRQDFTSTERLFLTVQSPSTELLKLL